MSQYARLWLTLHDVVVASNARAWNFVSTSDADRFTEFLEWQSTAADPIIERSDVAVAWRELNAAFPYEDSDTWKSAIS